MKILHISLLTPIPDVFPENDYLFKTAEAHLEAFPNDEVFIIRPVPYSNAFLSRLFPFNSAYRAIKNKESYTWKKFEVMLMPYISAKRINNIHSILCSSLFYLNKKRIKKFLHTHQIDVVHAQLLYPDAVLAYFLWKKFNIPYFITSHWELDYLENNISRFFTKRLLKNAKYIFPIAQVNQNTYLDIGINHTKVVPLGFDETFYNAERDVPPSDQVKIITVSRLIAQKNIDVIIRAFSDLRKKYNISFTVVGGGPEMENLVKLKEDLNLDEVYFTDSMPHEEIPEFIKNFDIFILASSNEAFGRVYFEAMAAGLPVICAKDTGIDGYFKDETEVLAAYGTDVEDVKRQLEKLITNRELRENMGKTGKELVKNYTWTNIVKDYKSYYNNVVKKG